MARRKDVATGRSKRSAKRRTRAHAVSDQPLPPRTRTGRSAAHRRFCRSAIWVRPGHVSTASTRGPAATAALSSSMSSGSAMTTGPGRPCMAVWKARDMISGMRATSSISTTHFAIEPKTAR